MAIWTITVPPEGKSTEFKDARDVAYVLADGSQLPLVAEPVWCHPCGRVTNGERTGTVAALDGMIAHHAH